jgi:hypothetical protein
VKGWKWAGDLRGQVCIIAALLFVIWIALQQQYSILLSAIRRLVDIGLKAKKIT